MRAGHTLCRRFAAAHRPAGSASPSQPEHGRSSPDATSDATVQLSYCQLMVDEKIPDLISGGSLLRVSGRAEDAIEARPSLRTGSWFACMIGAGHGGNLLLMTKRLGA